jgi:hypothetical protein
MHASRTAGIALAMAGAAWAAETEVLPLSGSGPDDAVPWEFSVTAGRRVGEKATIPVPSQWEQHGFGGYNYGHDKAKSAERGLYRRSFHAPAAWAGRRVHLVFEGVMTDAEVTLNGRSAGPQHQGGFYPFAFDVTDLVAYGASNTIEVAVDKVSANPRVEDAERIADYWVFGGIYRPVRIEVLPDSFIDHVAIRAEADGEFEAHVRLQRAAPDDRVAVRILDAAGALAGAAEAVGGPAAASAVVATARVASPRTWTAETPALYTAEVELRRGGQVVHRTRERFGFRTFEVRPGAGLFLNGSRVLLKGTCRHSFRPATGRCLSRADNLEDVRLMKSMNMNAVRCSHYPPDRAFLEACDELGLYVLDELAGWQKEPYDTATGGRLVREMVERDVNHPSILFWDNGNEGGWNRDLDDDFALYDPRRRPVLHPWDKFSGVDTDHYEGFSSIVKKLQDPTHVFLPTEHLHGLYDGGHGAGMADHWGLMKGSPNCGGLFFWVFADEGIARTDRGGAIDVDGLHAPDGIVGPNHEPEGSVLTVSELWSPVQIAQARQPLPADFGGALTVSNEYSFLNLSRCRFTWRLESFAQSGGKGGRAVQGTAAAPDVAPAGAGTLRVPLPADWRSHDVLHVTAIGPDDVDLWTWSWPLKSLPKDFETASGTAPRISENGDAIAVAAGGRRFVFGRADGRLISVETGGVRIPLANGPRLAPAGGATGAVTVAHAPADGGYAVTIRAADGSADASPGPGNEDEDARAGVPFGRASGPALPRISRERMAGPDRRAGRASDPDGTAEFRWLIRPDGSLQLDAHLRAPDLPVPFFGLTFDWPEARMKSVAWIGEGPYRVWKNRMHGTRFGLYRRDYSDPVPGESWIQPEFKGCFAGVRRATLAAPDATMTVESATPDLFLRLGTPRKPREDVPGYSKKAVENVFPPLPDGDISFLAAIPPIGTKFSRPDDGGPSGKPNHLRGAPVHMRLLFRFDPAPR